MRLPGEALLEFVIEPLAGRADPSRLVQTARFAPRGLVGIAYSYAVLSPHGLVFQRMLTGIGRAAEARGVGPGQGGLRGRRAPDCCAKGA